MKYDRPTHELLEECVSQLSEPIARQDIMRWFRSRYPAITEGTIAVSIQTRTSGLAGDQQHHRLMAMPPLLVAVGRGSYVRYRDDPRTGAERAHAATVTTTHSPLLALQSAVILIGCVKSKLPGAAAARELYTGTLFSKRRAYAEAAGVPWFVLSSRWGVVAPDEQIAPYDLYMGDTSRAYRRAWGEFAVAQLDRVYPVAGLRVEVHAGDAYVDAIRQPLERAGATVVDAVDARSFGETLAWYDSVSARPTESVPVEARVPAAEIAEPATFEPGDFQPASLDIDDLVTALASYDRALSVAQALAIPRSDWSGPGLYSWWVDEPGARELSAGLGVNIAAGMIYAGLAGATRWPSGRASANTLRGRLVGMHIQGTTEFSTFRRTLAASLSNSATPMDESSISRWMREHLKVVAVAVDDADQLGRIERLVLARLDPPLNLMSMPRSPARHALSVKRKELPHRSP